MHVFASRVYHHHPSSHVLPASSIFGNWIPNFGNNHHPSIHPSIHRRDSRKKANPQLQQATSGWGDRQKAHDSCLQVQPSIVIVRGHHNLDTVGGCNPIEQAVSKAGDLAQWDGPSRSLHSAVGESSWRPGFTTESQASDQGPQPSNGFL